MGAQFIRIGAIALAATFLSTACKSNGGEGKTASSGGLFGKKNKKHRKAARDLEKEHQKRLAANGLGDPSWGSDVNGTIGDARGRLPGFDSSSAPRRNPDTFVPVDPNRARALTYSRVKAGGPFVAMTFDDGPHPTNTPIPHDQNKLLPPRARSRVSGSAFPQWDQPRTSR